MEREKIEKVDLEELFGKRSFVEKTIYEEFVEGIGMLLCSYLNIKMFFCMIYMGYKGSDIILCIYSF